MEPQCPKCHSYEMVHKCYSPFMVTRLFKKNGWYCEGCGAGPFGYKDFDEADAARMMKKLGKAFCDGFRDEAISSDR